MTYNRVLERLFVCLFLLKLFDIDRKEIARTGLSLSRSLATPPLLCREAPELSSQWREKRKRCGIRSLSESLVYM